MGVLPFVAEDPSSAAFVFHERPIDLVHLARTTLGDPSLEGEMLEAFGLRAGMLILRMRQAARSSICAAAQTLKGSARGIGAWRVASAAEAVELAAASGAEAELKSAVDRLGVVAEETRAAIAECSLVVAAHDVALAVVCLRAGIAYVRLVGNRPFPPARL